VIPRVATVDHTHEVSRSWQPEEVGGRVVNEGEEAHDTRASRVTPLGALLSAGYLDDDLDRYRQGLSRASGSSRTSG